MDKKEFEKLRKSWYKKLAKDGFTDIEFEQTKGGLKTRDHLDSAAEFRFPRRFAAIDEFLNNPIFTLTMRDEEYRFLDEFRFIGTSSAVCKAQGLHPTKGKNIIKKYEEDWMYYLKYVTKQEDKLDD